MEECDVIVKIKHKSCDSDEGGGVKRPLLLTF